MDDGFSPIIHFLFKHIRHCEKAFSADEAIFIARITGMKDCFVVPPRNDDFSSRSMPFGYPCHSY